MHLTTKDNSSFFRESPISSNIEKAQKLPKNQLFLFAFQSSLLSPITPIMSTASTNSGSPLQVFSQVYKNLASDYQKNKNKRLLMVDLFIIYTLTCAMIQVRDCCLLIFEIVFAFAGCIHAVGWIISVQFLFVGLLLSSWVICFGR
jgi:hypothetical protein